MDTGDRDGTLRLQAFGAVCFVVKRTTPGTWGPTHPGTPGVYRLCLSLPTFTVALIIVVILLLNTNTRVIGVTGYRTRRACALRFRFDLSLN